jgi:hypothetical protein
LRQFEHRPAGRGTSLLTTFFWLVFVVASGAFGWLLRAFGPHAAVLQTEGLPLPPPGQWLVALSSQTRTTPGMVIAAGVVVALSVPLFRGARGRGGLLIYGTLALLAVAGATAAYWFLVRPVGMAPGELAPAPR